MPKRILARFLKRFLRIPKRVLARFPRFPFLRLSKRVLARLPFPFPFPIGALHGGRLRHPAQEENAAGSHVADHVDERMIGPESGNEGTGGPFAEPRQGLSGFRRGGGCLERTNEEQTGTGYFVSED